ncbi:hypothetical protein RIF29_08362 [Crotalaria pallida]|uniref:Uncharacterized protein n=1 Tax=Crotalaria pallida TaxID=3830 RepID=A0AAN9IH96_CROPI
MNPFLTSQLHSWLRLSHLITKISSASVYKLSVISLGLFVTSKMTCLLAIILFFVVPCAALSFNVVDYGAKGDGQTDDSQAFLKAWQDVCDATCQGTPSLLIPNGKTFMLQPVKFMGPCKPATINIQLEGTIIAPNSVEAWKWPNDDGKKDKWVQFSDIDGLVINGGGTIDGQGAPWWKFKSATRPAALHFHKCGNLKLTGLTHRNSPMNHISINECIGPHISNLHIIAPADSPNTDGIDISRSSNVTVQNSRMETGDDCIAINDGTSFINISGVYCGPGHGISIGSLGKDGAHNTVEEVHVQNCTFNGTTNGARIKTWEGGSGHAKRVTFEDIILVNTENPVIIDQQYDPNCYGLTQAVQISDVTYRNIRGTAACNCAIKLSCDSTIGCNGIVMENINITAAHEEKIYASCKNAQGICSSCIPNVPCLHEN